MKRSLVSTEEIGDFRLAGERGNDKCQFLIINSNDTAPFMLDNTTIS